MSTKLLVKVFLASSFFSIVTLGYTGLAFYEHGRPSDIPIESIALILPFLYGMFGVLNFMLINQNIYYSIIVGICFGLFLSSLGRFILNLPIRLFSFTKKNQYEVHIYAMLIYSIVFSLLLTPTQKYLFLS